MQPDVVPITEAQRRLHALAHQAEERDVVIGIDGRPIAVLMSPGRLEDLYGRIDDLGDRLSVYESMARGLARLALGLTEKAHPSGG